MNLQESIRRILREYHSPAGKKIIPNEIVVHKSAPYWRENILETGLQVSVGECYQVYVGDEIKCKPAIFATNSTNREDWFSSTYDDDVWFIDTTKIPDVKWYKDKHFKFNSESKHIVTFQDIPSEALTLHYEGSGKSEDLLQESIDKTLNEKTIDITTILRRVRPSELEKEFEYRLKKENPCEYESFDDFFNWVAWRTEDTIHYKIRENEKLNLDFEQERNFRKMIQDFIYNNFSDVAKKYYNYYKRIHCPNK